MSTRATYRIFDPHADVTFYIHHDNYPSGAAAYFKAMLDARGRMDTYNHGLAECFFRANPNAEFTARHENHGDTDYRFDLGSAHASYMGDDSTGTRYGVSTFQLRAYACDNWTHPFFEGDVRDFIEKYGEED